MALLKPSVTHEKEQVRLQLDKYIVDEIRAYCQWAGITKLEEFVEQASEHVLKKDRDWQASMPHKNA